VVKNSLSELAADRAGAEHLKPLLSGPVALTFVKGDPAAAAKSLNDTARATNLLEFKGGVLGGQALSAEDVRSIARLPAREVLQAQLVGAIAAPLSGLVRTLNALIAGVAIQLKAIADQGLVGQSAPVSASAPVPQDPEAPAEVPADAQPAAEQRSDDPDSEPHDAPVQPSQAEGEDTNPQED
jgi:large subunit ribosomal protein L10